MDLSLLEIMAQILYPYYITYDRKALTKDEWFEQLNGSWKEIALMVMAETRLKALDVFDKYFATKEL